MMTRWRMHGGGWMIAAAVVVMWGCGAAEAQPKAADHDKPVAASEPRAELVVAVDLPPSQACEEAFDLALYQDRRIELVAWDDNAGACTDRKATVRYLSKKIAKEQLLDLMRKHAVEVKP